MLIWVTLMILTMISLLGLTLEGVSYMNLHNNMQEIADAAALSGANELDGAKGARSRATAKAQSYLANTARWSNIGLSGSQIASVKFYSSLADVASDKQTNSDSDAAYIRVSTVSRGIATSFLQLSPIKSVYTNAKATAVSQYITCAPVQSFMCNPYEDDNTTTTGDGSSFLSSSGAKIGDMFKLVEGSGASGDWGLIQPPGTNGNPNKNQPPWWSQSGVSNCFATNPGSNQFDTSPGNTAKFAVDGMNVRFDTPSSTSGVNSASSPVVISGFTSPTGKNATCGRTVSATPKSGTHTFSQTNACDTTSTCTATQTAQYTAYDTYCSGLYGSCPLPRDRVFAQLGKSTAWGSMLKGSGVNSTDLSAYWTNHHSGALPGNITTRYQLYQEEVKALTDSSNPAVFTSGSESQEPAAPQCSASLPAGGVERRLINVAIVDCNYWGIKGRKALPPATLTARFFMTEPAQSDGSIYGELVDVLQSNVSGGPVHHLIRLVQ